MSIKRNVIMDDFADEIAELYSVPVNTTNVVARREPTRMPKLRAPRRRSVSGPFRVRARQNQSLSRISRIAIRRVSGGSRSR